MQIQYLPYMILVATENTKIQKKNSNIHRRCLQKLVRRFWFSRLQQSAQYGALYKYRYCSILRFYLCVFDEYREKFGVNYAAILHTQPTINSILISSEDYYYTLLYVLVRFITPLLYTTLHYSPININHHGNLSYLITYLFGRKMEVHRLLLFLDHVRTCHCYVKDFRRPFSGGWSTCRYTRKCIGLRTF